MEIQDIASMFAYIGGTIMAINMVPQIYQIIKTQKVEDINQYTLIMNVTGLSCYMFYGLTNGLLELVIPISFSLACNVITLSLKIKYS